MGIVAGTSAGNSINRGLLALFLFHSFGPASVYFSSPSSPSNSSGNNDKEEDDEDVLFELCKLHVAVDDGLGHQATSFQQRIPILFHILRARIPTLGLLFNRSTQTEVSPAPTQQGDSAEAMDLDGACTQQSLMSLTLSSTTVEKAAVSQ